MTGESGQQAAEGRTIAKRAGTVAIFTLLSRILGYVRDAAITNIFGPGVAFDAFVAAQTIPYVLRRLVAEGSLMIAFVPLLAEEKNRGGLAAMQAFTRAVLGALIPVLIVLTGLGMLFPEAAIELLAGGFDEERAQLGAYLVPIMMPFLFFVSLLALAGGVLNIEGIFAPTAAAPILLNVTIVLCAIFGRQYFDVPIAAVAFGVALGGVVQLLLQLPFLRRQGLLVWPKLDLKHPTLRTLGVRMLPAVYGVGVYQLNIFIIRRLASYLPQGELSCYFLASRLQEFALGVFAVSISIAALPTLSEHAARGDRTALWATFRRAIRATNFITIPATAGLFVMAKPLVGVLFRHGATSAASGLLTTKLVMVMAVALVPIGAVRVIVPTYYAVGDTKTPVIAATASMFTTLGVGWYLAQHLAIVGLTIATMTAAVVQLTVLVILLRRRIEGAVTQSAGEPEDPSAAPPPKAPTILGHGLKCLIAIAPGAALAHYLSGLRVWFEGGNVVGGIVVVGIVGAVVIIYAGLGWVLGIAEVAMLLGVIRRRLRRSS